MVIGLLIHTKATERGKLTPSMIAKPAAMIIWLGSGTNAINNPTAKAPDAERRFKHHKFGLYNTLPKTFNAFWRSDLPEDRLLEAEIDKGSIELSVNDIVKSGGLEDSALFYLHRVTEADRQGLWGIIQSGLIQRFRQGLALEGINKDLVRVTIPADADEPLPTGLSSFLGKVLSNKVESSYIYNYTTSTMGHNPDLIYPGQQLILIHFSTKELKDIYQFFADQRNEQAQTFAIH